MAEKLITMLDGNKEKRTEVMKEFFGLKAEQSFQDIDVELTDEDANNER